MIRTIDVDVNAANPNMPLCPFESFVGAPASVRVRNVPRQIGEWRITDVFVSVTMPDNAIRSRAAKLVGGVWVATIPASAAVGTSSNGFTISANGKDENGASVTGFVLGKGDVIILTADGTITVGETTYYIHILQTTPTNPKIGDFALDTLKLWNGTAWVSLGGGGGDMSHSEFAALPSANLSPDETGITELCTIINQMKNLLRPAVIIAALVAALGANAAHVETNQLKNLKGASNVVTHVELPSVPDYFKSYATNATIKIAADDIASGVIPAPVTLPTFTAIATNGAAVVALTNAAVASAVVIASGASVTNAGAVAYAEGKFLTKSHLTGDYGHIRWNEDRIELYMDENNPYGELSLSTGGTIQNGNVDGFSWILDDVGNTVEDRFGEILPMDNPSYGGENPIKRISWGEEGLYFDSTLDADIIKIGNGGVIHHTIYPDWSWLKNGTGNTLDYALNEKANATSVYTKGETDARAGVVATNTFAALAIPATNDVFSLAKNYTSNSVANVQSIVQTWESFLDGSNVVFSITNYISGTYSLDTAKLRIMELRNGTNYVEVYNSRDEIAMHVNAFKTNDFRIATNSVVTSVNSQIAQKADRAWGKYTSTGEYIQDVGYSNTVYITEPQTVFAGGTEYARFAVGEGSICVLTAKGAAAYTSGDEGTFKFQDAGGTNYFGFARTDSYAIGADASGITVLNNVVTITYDITTSVKPCIWYKEDLTSTAPWEQLNLPDGTQVPGASHYVSWEQNPPAGKQVCAINCQEAKGFFRASIEVAGTAKFITNMPADLKAGIICTNTATGANGVVRPSFNGSTVNWTWSAQ